MGLNIAQKLIESHLLSGAMTAGKEIGIRIDQTLTQDATGTLVMLELESMGLDSARSECSPSAPAAWKSPWPSRESRSMSKCHRSGGSVSRERFPIGYQPKMSSWRCCAVTRPTAAKAESSSTMDP